MNYKNIYNNLITKAKERVSLNEYYEFHHIIPKSIGGDNSNENLVKLTLKEHYFAHELLCEIYPDSKELSYALWIMTITTLSAKKKFENNSSTFLSKRENAFLDEKGKNIRISSNEYENAKKRYCNSKLGKKYTLEEKTNVSKGTKKAMKNEEIIKKCISGSKGCKYYRSKIDGSVHKWFPNDGDIDLSIYEWGRYKMTEDQKKKISEANHLKKRYFIIPNVNAKYTLYEDYVNELPNDWEEKWTNESNKKLRNIIIEANRKFNIKTNFKYDKCIIFNVPNKSKNFKIITPSLYIVCNDVLKKWRNDDIIDDLVASIEKNIDIIVNLNKKYMKI